ncbi:putative inorganic phosphate cotransporter [Trichonephila inaurata madagascariensis]|uniref:Putative inorganic phosphate cotransporter n=1 Tax=Trichonephila inaurata madagascariensis TaxID=2747483 RepID=A0A8X6MGI6_9ARAC|nr:putative inorganic phosphate cotransporter [Trichonephila inaurata madagascariensis]
MIGRWSPKTERSRISTIIFTGSQMGNVIAMPVSGWLSSTDLLGGWPSVFYVFGSLGCVWFLAWSAFIYETPSQHPNISKEELLFIEQNKDEKTKQKNDIPWKDIFTSLPMWAVIVAHFGHNFGFLILLTEMPTYLSTILHFDIKSNGILSALPYVVQAMSAWLASYLADRIRESGRLSITNIRKVSNSIGLFGPAICLLGVTVSGCRPELIVALLSMALALNGFIYSGFNITHVDMSPEYAGPPLFIVDPLPDLVYIVRPVASTIFGITNAISNVCGIIGPMIVGYFTASGATIANWSDVFYVTAAVYTVGAVFYAIFASAELQPWGVRNSAQEKKCNFDSTSAQEKKCNLDSTKS